MGNVIIKLEDFSYRYPLAAEDEMALKNISFEIEEGDFVGIVGCNKAGKSTLCQVMVGIIPFAMGGDYDGKVFVDHKDFDETHGNGATDVIGVVFQDAESQFTQETVEDEIAFALCNFGYEHDEMSQRILEAAKACSIEEMLDRSPFKLSGGQQQRLAVACILALRPRVIILDESTSQLDPVGRDEVFSLVKKLHSAGSTVIMVEHNIEKIAQYANKVMILQDGQIKYFDEIKHVFQDKAGVNACMVRLPQVADAAVELKDRLHYKSIPISLEEAVPVFKVLLKEGKNHG